MVCKFWLLWLSISQGCADRNHKGLYCALIPLHLTSGKHVDLFKLNWTEQMSNTWWGSCDFVLKPEECKV